MYILSEQYSYSKALVISGYNVKPELFMIIHSIAAKAA